MRLLRWTLGAAVLFAGLCLAQTPTEVEEPAATEGAQAATTAEEVLVTGEYPGPGMWKVTRRDDLAGHTLWILGTPPPLPKKLKWKSKDVEATVVSSQRVLLDSQIDVEPDAKIGFFKGMALLPSALGIRSNPDKARLQDLLPPDLYAQWLVQKQKYLGRNASVETWRPIFAAAKLRSEALDDLKLRESGVVWEVVEKLTKKHKIEVTTPTVSFTFKTADIKSRIQQFKRQPLADQDCFAASLQFIEMLGDSVTMNERAHAWATGDLSSLLALHPLPNSNAVCAAALLGSQLGQELVPSDILAQLKSAWVEAAEKSLGENQSTFALLSLSQLTGANGRLAALRDKGYVVEDPVRD